jgi:hypothetical protein
VIHARDTIRQALVAALAAGGTSAGSRVYDTPSDTRATFPALVVEELGESQRALTMPGGSGRTIERLLTLRVSAELQQVSGYAAARNTLLADVEAIAVSATLTGAKSIVPVAYQPDMATTGERPIVVGHQIFEVLYVTTQGDPSSTL